MRAVPLICVALLPVRAAAPKLHISVPGQPGIWTSCQRQLCGDDRAQVMSRLNAHQGRHLVIVRYKPDHDPDREWVYNDADINGEKVVWARDMGTPKNQELIEFFKGRQVWLIQADEELPKISPYPLPQAQSFPPNQGDL